MSRPFTIKLGENEAALIREVNGVFSIEPMRFLTPGQAKLRRTKDQKCWPAKPKEKRPPVDWQAQARDATRSLVEAIERAGVRP